MLNLFSPIWESAARLERVLVGYLLAVEPSVSGLMVGLLFAGVITGSRLAKFSHPAKPRVSLLVRHCSSAFIVWPSWLMLIALVILAGLIVSLAFSLGWQLSVWGALKVHLSAIAAGAIAGAILGGLGYYHWIPGVERPIGVGVSEPVPKSCRLYDPEKYFRV